MILEFLRRWYNASKRVLELEAQVSRLSERCSALAAENAMQSAIIKNLNGQVAELKGQLKEIPAPAIDGTISYTELMALLVEQCPEAKIYLSDNEYGLTPVYEMNRFLAEEKTNLQKYIAEKHDCDDFAWSLLGSLSEGPWAVLAAGFAWSNVHAFNVFVDNKRELYIIEPQNDVCRRYEGSGPLFEPIKLLVM